MPWSLKRFQEARCLHFITFSCHHREQLLGTPEARDVFERTLEKVRGWYGFYVRGYVVMPEHVHLLVSEPRGAKLSTALQMLKQNVARELRLPEGNPFWQERYYDFNVWSEVSGLRNCGISIGILRDEVWFRNRRTGSGVAFSITRPELMELCRLSRSGRCGNGNELG